MNVQLEGFSEKEVQSMINNMKYRKEYNRRPEVIEKRKLYMKRRNEEMKLGRELLKKVQQDPNLCEHYGLGKRFEI